MNDAYTFISESVNLENKEIRKEVSKIMDRFEKDSDARTSAIMKHYPKPETLKRKLEKSSDESVKKSAAVLSNDMTPQQYKSWLSQNASAKRREFMIILLKIAIITAGVYLSYKLSNGRQIILAY